MKIMEVEDHLAFATEQSSGGEVFCMTYVEAADYLVIPRAGGVSWRIARRARPALGSGVDQPGLMWLGGFASDMRGGKASFLDAHAAARGLALLRFDYSGHGESDIDTPGGRFEEGAISDWLEQSLAIFDASSRGPQILIGSSMGAWIALLLARRLNELGFTDRLRALVLLAPAVDFTEALLWNSMSDSARREIMEKGHCARSSMTRSTPVTRRLIEDGRSHLLLGGPVRAHAPVHILQGMIDTDVPWRHAMLLVERLVGDPVTVSLIADGDHRLSRPQDLAMLAATLDNLA